MIHRSRDLTRTTRTATLGTAFALGVALATAPVAQAQSAQLPIPDQAPEPVVSSLANANGALGDATEALEDALRPAAHAIHDATGGLPPGLEHLAPPNQQVIDARQSALDTATGGAGGTGARAGACVVPLDQPEPMQCSGDTQFMYAASTIKVAVAVAALEKSPDFERPVEVTETYAGGVGAGTYTVGDLVHRMITASDNNATNALIDDAGGFAAINAISARVGLGDRFRVGNYMNDLVQRPDYGRLSSKSGAEYMAELWKSARGSGALTSERVASHVLGEMHQQNVRTKLARDLPRNEVANKTGETLEVSHDVGVLYTRSGPVAVAVTATGGAPDGAWAGLGPALVGIDR